MFVPVISTQDGSPHAQELGRRIANVIREYRGLHPDAGGADVHFALRLAERETGGLGPARRVLLMSAVLGVLVLAGLLFFLGEAGDARSFPMIAVMGLVGVLAVLLALVKAMRR